MLPPKFPFNRHPYCVTLHFPFCCSSNTLLICGNSLDSTQSTQLKARLNNAFGRQLTEEYIGYKHNIIFIWKGFLSWLIYGYLQVRPTWMLPQKFPFNRHPYCVTLHFLFCCSSNTLLIRQISLESTKSTQLKAALTTYFDDNSLENTLDTNTILYSFERDFWADKYVGTYK